MSSSEKDGPRRGDMSAEDRAEFRERASEIGRRLEAAKSQRSEGERGQPRSTSASREVMGRALLLSTELIAGIVVGAALGWWLDQQFGTWPALFIVFFLLGSAAGMLNIVRSGLKMKTGPSDPSKGPAAPDDEDDDR